MLSPLGAKVFLVRAGQIRLCLSGQSLGEGQNRTPKSGFFGHFRSVVESNAHVPHFKNCIIVWQMQDGLTLKEPEIFPLKCWELPHCSYTSKYLLLVKEIGQWVHVCMCVSVCYCQKEAVFVDGATWGRTLSAIIATAPSGCSNAAPWSQYGEECLPKYIAFLSCSIQGKVLLSCISPHKPLNTSASTADGLQENL